MYLFIYLNVSFIFIFIYFLQIEVKIKCNGIPIDEPQIPVHLKMNTFHL